MSDTSQNDNNYLNLENFDGEEIMLYRKKAEDVVTFIMVHGLKDLENPLAKKTNSFKPDMAHQIFGESESIFGYKNLSIDLYYLHNSARCFVDVKSSGQIKNGTCKPDDIMALLNPWLPEDYRTKREDFIKDLSNETNKVYGEIIDNFESKKKYKIALCDSSDEDFKNFHQRFETLIIWYIDGANFIDLDDPRWLFFYIYEENQDERSNSIVSSPIGFCTVYKFYLHPDSERPRISQFFILPSHQKRGLGTKFYSSIFNYLKNLPNVIDITVEEPTPILQKLRDFADSLLVFNDLKKLKLTPNPESPKKITSEIIRKHKICKKQCQRVIDILACLNAQKNGSDYKRFLEEIKNRIGNDVEKDTRGSKRICNLERIGMIAEPVDKKATIEIEFKKYIESIEAPVQRLEQYLSNIN